jgi:hypothetical protein
MKKVTCSYCGTRVAPGTMAHHHASQWHKYARRAREMRKEGMHYAEITRQLELVGATFTRAFVWQQLKKEGL